MVVALNTSVLVIVKGIIGYLGAVTLISSFVRSAGSLPEESVRLFVRIAER